MPGRKNNIRHPGLDGRKTSKVPLVAPTKSGSGRLDIPHHGHQEILSIGITNKLKLNTTSRAFQIYFQSFIFPAL
jgi:hypothetical protein